MSFELLGVPVRIHPLILVTAVFIGPRDNPLELLVWVPMVLVGVLLHELGHALLVQRLGRRPAIELHAMGGTTSWHDGGGMTAGQRIAVSAAGPAVGIAVGLVCLGAWRALSPMPGGLVDQAMSFAVFVNLGWGILNLAPVLPLDGGNIVTTAAERVAGRRGRIVMLGVSVALTVALAVWAVTAGQWWLAIIGGVLTAANLQAMRAERG